MYLTETKILFDEMPNFTRIGKIRVLCLSCTEFPQNVMPQISLERVLVKRRGSNSW